MHALYTLQEISIGAGFKESTEFTEIRAQLKLRWDEAKDLLQECFSITSTVALIEDAAPTAKHELMIILLNELVEICEKCHSQAQELANLHSIPMERYKKFETTLQGFAQPASQRGQSQDHPSNGLMAMSEAMSKFTTAYEILQGKLDDMVTFFTGEVQRVIYIFRQPTGMQEQSHRTKLGNL